MTTTKDAPENSSLLVASGDDKPDIESGGNKKLESMKPLNISSTSSISISSSSRGGIRNKEEVQECEIQLDDILNECEEVDMNDPDMDPIEWTVRKIIPIPRNYYWDMISNEAVSDKVSIRTKVWHNMIYFMVFMYTFWESYIARPLANTMGLTEASSSRYVNHGITDEEYERSKKLVKERKLRTAKNSNKVTPSQHQQQQMGLGSKKKRDTTYYHNVPVGLES